jgi:hypothetical protein
LEQDAQPRAVMAPVSKSWEKIFILMGIEACAALSGKLRMEL